MPRRPIVVLTGAGISAESGVATFRDGGGLWEKHAIADVASPEGFERNPSLVHRFYSERRAQLFSVEPNDAHQALAEYARRHPGELFLVTQNVDDLHERAGSPEVIHMHGQLREVRCETCSTVHPWLVETTVDTVCPSCGVQGTVRPHIVWFGEVPLFLEEIAEALANCEIFLSIGTSGNVYPAAGFFATARRFGARTVELNLEPSENAHQFDERRYGPAATLVRQYLSYLEEQDS